MMTLPLILADAAPDPMISGSWIIAVIGAIAAGIALVVGKKQGRAEAADNNVTIKQPVPTVPMSKVPTPPTWDAHKALCDLVTALEQVTKELRRDIAGQYRELMQAGAAREVNISDKLDGIARGIHARIDDLMKPKTGR